MPEFSIIIPVYKVEKYIEECLNSVVNQTYGNFEALVVDDCGGDNSIQIAEEFAQNDERIKIIHHDRNKGLAAARNTALKAACGKYIVCLDSDDLMEPQCLQVIKTEFELRKTESIWFNMRKYYETEKRYEYFPMREEDKGYRILTPENIMYFSDFSWIKAYTRESIQRYNLEWPDGIIFEDDEFYYKYFTLYPRTYAINDCLITYRVREGSICYDANRGKGRITDMLTVLEHLREFWIKIGVYDKYKRTMLNLVQKRIKTCINLQNTEECKVALCKFIQKINYKEELDGKTEEEPLVSIVIPIYKVEKYISSCIESVQKQLYKNLEILCIDDYTTDKSAEIAEKYAQNDSRIKIITHDKNKGLGGARNTGLKSATGKYIFFLDSDDRLAPDCISTVVQKLEETQLNTVWFKAKVWWENNNEYSDMFFFNYYDKYPDSFLYLDENNLTNFALYSWNKGYKTKFLKDNNLYWRENMYFEDVEFYFKLFTLAPETYLLDKRLYLYTRRDDSITRGINLSQREVKDLYKAVVFVKDFLVSNNLFQKYSPAFYKYLNDVLSMYKKFSEFDKTLTDIKLKLLSDLKSI